MRQHLLAFAFALLGPLLPATAMEFNPVGDTLVLSGAVDGGDLVRLKDQLAQRRFRLVLLHDSPGGDLFNGYQLAHWIRSEGLHTAVSGKCESACALLFLGGVRRSFSDGRPLGETMVGLHGAHHFQTGEAMPELSPRMAYVIRTMTDGRYPPELMERTVYPKHPLDLVYAFHPLRFKPGAGPQGVMECLKQAGDAFKCTMIDGLDAIAIGVVTDPDILVLDDQVKAILERL